MTGTFKANHPYNNLLLALYALLLRLYFFSSPSAPAILPDDGFLYRHAIQALLSFGLPSGFFSFLTFLLLFAQALVLNRISSGQRMFPKPNYLPGMSYLLIAALLPEMNRFSSVLITNSLLLWMFGMISRLHHAPSPKSLLFNLGMICAFSSLLYFPAGLFLLLIIMGMLIFRPFVIREWIVMILGFATPYYLLLTTLFLYDRLDMFSFLPLHFSGMPLSFSLTGKISLIAAAWLLISGIYFNRKESGKQLVHAKKCWSLVFVLVILSLAVLFLDRSHSACLLIGPVLPLSWMAANVFYYPSRSWYPSLLHGLLLAWILYIQLA